MTKLYNSNITEKIFKNCDHFGNKTIIETVGGKKINGNEYKKLSIFYAKKLLESGVKNNDSIVVFIKDIVDFSAYAMAVLLVGAKLVIIESDYSEKILEEKIKFIKPDLVIIEGFLYTLLNTPIINKYNKIKKYNSLIDYSKNIITNRCKYDDDVNLNIDFINDKSTREALVVFTGGTTGSPKGVVHTIETLEVMFRRIHKIIGSGSINFFADLPHFVLIGISMGVKVIVGENNMSDKKFLNILNTFKIDTTFSPPYRYLNIVNSKKTLPRTLKHICLGSAPIYKSFLNKIYAKASTDTKVTCIYGMTEILPVSFIDGKEKLHKNIDGDILGKPFTDINIITNKLGELVISGNGLFKSYLGEEVIKNHNTGDIVDYLDGNLVMKGRTKDMILKKDYNIYPSLYEPIINSIEGVIESALVGIREENLEDEKIILFIEGKNINKNYILKKIKNGSTAIDIFALPDEIVFCTIPRKGRQNKIDKNYLRNNYNKIGK